MRTVFNIDAVLEYDETLKSNSSQDNRVLP